jgi:hypothetical protein
MMSTTVSITISFPFRFLDSANEWSLQQRGITLVMNSLGLAAVTSGSTGIAMAMTDARIRLTDMGFKGGRAY